MNNKFTYLVSVYVTTYFHENYIAKAIDSILNQKVNFKYEIVISDDASKDRTQNIVKKYAAQYDFIRFISNQTNLGLTKNVFQARVACNGKYIIQLSGDDYWIDDRKLQKQVDFLELHGEYIGVTTRIESRTEESDKADFITPNLSICNKVFTLKDYLKGNNFPTNGILLRNCIKEKNDLFSIMPKLSLYIDDETDCLLILSTGSIVILSDITVAYRRRIENENEHNFNSINRGIEKLEKHIDLLNNIYKYFNGKIDLFNRYKIALGPEIAKHYRYSSRRRFHTVVDSIPEEYINRGLIIKSMIYDIKKTYEVLTRKYRTQETVRQKNKRKEKYACR